MKKQLLIAVTAGFLLYGNTQCAQAFEPASGFMIAPNVLTNDISTDINTINSSTETKSKYKKKQKSVSVTPSKSVAGTKQLSQKDLTIEGKVEKSEDNSLYHGQSSDELQTLVFDVAQKIMQANNMKKNINIKYVSKDEENANVNITNTIKVYKGIIKACQTEDELAYVIGHEMGHSNSYHVAKGVGVGVASSAASTAATYGIAAVTNSYWARWGVSTATDYITKLGAKKIDRVHETNADLLSIDYIVKAGYNPLAAIAIMNKIGDNYLDVLSDHPSTDKRVTKMYNYISQKYPEYLSAGYNSVYYNQALTTINNINQSKQSQN